MVFIYQPQCLATGSKNGTLQSLHLYCPLGRLQHKSQCPQFLLRYFLQHCLGPGGCLQCCSAAVTASQLAADKRQLQCESVAAERVSALDVSRFRVCLHGLLSAMSESAVAVILSRE